MPTLNVGVVDLPHGDDGLTTGDLAEILEAKYDLFRGFVEDNLDKIADQMADALDGALNNMLNGAAVPENPYAEAMEWVGARFREFINSGEVERLGLIGVPTEAALKGVNHRLKIKRGGATAVVRRHRIARGLVHCLDGLRRQGLWARPPGEHCPRQDHRRNPERPEGG